MFARHDVEGDVSMEPGIRFVNEAEAESFERIEARARVRLPRAPTQEAEALAADLARTTDAEVRFGAADRALYATDSSNYRQLPIGVVVPRTIEDVVRTIAVCRAHGAPVLSRGCGTSLAGQCCNVAVVVDMSKHLRGLLELDPARKRARVLPGTVLDTLRHAANEFDLTFGPDPSTHAYCTLGGMIGNNSCGTHSVMSGRTVENVEELEVLTYDGLRMRVGATTDEELAAIVRAGGRRGEIYAKLRALRDRYARLIRERTPQIPRRVSGYNLDELLPEKGFHVARALVGTEGTCVTVLEATLRLVDWPRARSLIALGYPDIYTAADHAMRIRELGPLAIEAIDDGLIKHMHTKKIHEESLARLPEGRAFLLVEVGGATKEESDANARRIIDTLEREPDAPKTKLYDDEEEEKAVWLARESGLGATARVPGQRDTWEGWEDSAVHPAKLGGYLRELRKLYDAYGYQSVMYGHFGDGCVHCRVTFDLFTKEGIAKWRRFMEDATDLVVRFGGSFSGEHGDGQSKAEFLYKMYGEELVRAFGEFKAIWDPEGKMNPGKIVDPYRIDQNLRFGAGFHDAKVDTHFAFPDDSGSWSRATQRCVGVGKCRETQGATMCPSYQVTLEEKHSTRGRAHLLFEMLQKDELDGMKSDGVREALDLCLACKGCKSECPVNVDMATYKAEFLSHYYRHRLRPRAAYAMGLVFFWARLASLAPGLVNMVSRSKLLGPIVKRLGGVAPEREVPAFAKQTFRSWFEARAPKNANGREVVLFADTFNDHFFPHTAIAATEVLETLGYRVLIPERRVCCGRPLYDYGMLDLAKKKLLDVLDALEKPIERGTPIVGLEPSCLAVFKDELVNMLPNDERAKRLHDLATTFADFLVHEDVRLPRLDLPAIVHGHCHHKAILEMKGEDELLHRLGVEVESPDAGCCGMAGSFGFEAGEKYEVSMKAGERVLLPAVRSAAKDALVIADGFSCREQIGQATDRRALHVAEVVRMAIAHDGAGERRAYPERAILPDESDVPRASLAVVGSIGACAATAFVMVATRPREVRIDRRARRKAATIAIGAAAALVAIGFARRLRRRRREARSVGAPQLHA